MSKATKIDCYGVCGYGQEDAVLAAYERGDILALGKMCKARIDNSVNDRIDWDQRQKDKYRAEILAEGSAGGEA